MEKLATLDTTSNPSSPWRKRAKRISRSRLGVLPVISGASRRAASRSSWSMYWPITSVGSPGWRARTCSTTPIFDAAVEPTR